MIPRVIMYGLKSIGYSLLLGSLVFTPFHPAWALRDDDTEKTACQHQLELWSKNFKGYCGDSYHHYCAASAERKQISGFSDPCSDSQEKFNFGGESKMAGFNVLYLGSGVTKSIQLMAQMIDDRWDLVGTVEIKKMGRDQKLSNFNLIQLLKDSAKLNRLAKKYEMTRQELESQAYMAGYLELLSELHALELARGEKPSWSLVLSNTLHPEVPRDTDNNGGELYGFYYRASVIRAIPTELCEAGREKNLGCAIKAKKYRESLGRKPFVASFDLGIESLNTAGSETQKISYALAHTRSRIPKVNGKEMKSLPGEWLNFFDPQGGFERKERVGNQDKKVYSVTDIKEQLRFIEITAMVDLIGTAIREGKLFEDTLFFGDYNVPVEEYAKEWTQALRGWPGTWSWVDTPTSLGFEKLGNQFDHVVSSGDLEDYFGRCAMNAFDFTKNYSPLVDYIWAIQNDAQKQEQALEELQQRMKRKVIKMTKIQDLYTKKEMDTQVKNFKKAILNPPAKHRLKPFRRTMSDHLPVEVSCYE